MSVEKVRNYLKKWNRDKDIIETEFSTATVELAASAIGVVPARIAKSLVFKSGGNAVMVVTAGDSKIENRKFKEAFGFKPKMLRPEEALNFTGYAAGGNCPFGINEDIEIYLDKSLLRFETVFPACGSANSAIELTLDDLEEYSNSKGWVDVCKI